jgi:hypothetical protein
MILIRLQLVVGIKGYAIGKKHASNFVGELSTPETKYLGVLDIS